MNKRAEFATLLHYVKPDIVFGTETWIPPNSTDASVLPDTYTNYRRDRGSIGGGIFILVHKSLTSIEIPEFDGNCEMKWVKLQLKRNRDLILGCFYMPQRCEKDLKELEKILDKITGSKRDKDVLLSGDFNCPNINWQNDTVDTNAPQKEIQEKLIEITAKSHLTQIHDQSTRETNTLDLIFASNPSLKKFSLSIPGCSDHDAVVADFDAKPLKSRAKPKKCQLFSKANWDKISEDLKPLGNEIGAMKRDGADTNSMWEAFKSAIKNAVSKHVPTILRRNSHDLPWLTRDLQKLIKRKNRLHRRAKKTKNWSNYRFCQKECRRRLRKAEQDYVNSMLEKGLQEKDSKPFWRYVKAKRRDNSGVAPLKDGPTLVSDSLSKARLLLGQFCSVFTRSVPVSSSMNSPPKPSIDVLTIQEEGVAKLLRNLNASKASGPDEIPSKVLKNCASILAAPLTCIFNRSLETGTLPSDWLTANVSCIYKKGDRNRAENYRPVSLTSVACKLLEHCICRHLWTHLERNDILTNRNHGFRSGYSCETQLLTTMHDLQKTNDAGIQSDVIILDFSKAFDTVPHPQLLLKLEHYGVRGQLHKWIASFLTQRTMKVVLEGQSSEEAAVESGVPQGTVLGPLLFLCHINDLPESVNSTVRLFADDCLLYRAIHSMQDHIALQEDLKKLEGWAKEWGMRFNARKCYTMQTKTNSSFLYQLDGHILQQVPENPYLGVQIAANLKWSAHTNYVGKKANSILGFLRRNLGNCPKECRRLAYITLVRSVLDYGAIVWSPYLEKDITKLERVQKQAARFITKDYSSRETGCVTNMLKELGLHSLQERRRQQRLSMLYKISEGLIPGLPRDQFLTPMEKGKRKIKLKTFDGHQATNLIAKHTSNNSKGYKVPFASTEQYNASFFVQTVFEWNQLPESVVQAGSTAAFSAAVNRAAHM
jgi:hypothetical protein